MDVVNGKIVSARTERSDLWSAVKPSRSGLEGNGPCPHGKADQLGSLASWAVPSYFGGSMSPPHPWGASASAHGHGHGQQRPSSAPSMALEPGAARWNRSARDNILGYPHKQSVAHVPPPFVTGLPRHPVHVVHPVPTVHDFQPGWKRTSLKVTTGVDHYTRQCTHSERALFDKELSMYESQISRAVSGHFSSFASTVGQETGTTLTGTSLGDSSSTQTAQPKFVNTGGVTVESLETRSGKNTLTSSTSIKGTEGATLSSTASDPNSKDSPECSANNGSEPGGEMQPPPPCESTRNASTCNLNNKRQRLELSQNDQDQCTWIAPLRFLIRKGLSMSDVGELGRIVLPKKDAEGQLPQIDTKEGKMLEMEEYSSSKRWFFRYKWWINNKSRMYVLENTGEFIKYHGLKEHDSFVVYEDGCGKLVVRGQKKTTFPEPVLDLAKCVSNVGNPSDKPAT